jgi:hypothetical protein
VPPKRSAKAADHDHPARVADLEGGWPGHRERTNSLIAAYAAGAAREDR